MLTYFHYQVNNERVYEPQPTKSNADNCREFRERQKATNYKQLKSAHERHRRYPLLMNLQADIDCCQTLPHFHDVIHVISIYRIYRREVLVLTYFHYQITGIKALLRISIIKFIIFFYRNIDISYISARGTDVDLFPLSS